MKNLNGEIIVVDNNSVDGSTSLVKEKFPGVLLIENKKNTGFSVANNQGIQQSKGDFILLLNPDTVIQEDTLEKIISFMEVHPDAGGLGVKMVDGKGNFLPESKRGLPTPAVAFYKIFGLAKLFPQSKRFGAYHLTYLNKNQIHEVDVLSGAFMLLRKKALDKTGLLDETFFMYGEDIDLSYRLQLAGYKNYYFPETTIIHYKGESTKKSSVNYVFVFYKAMKIFARKHFNRNNAGLFILLINLAIYLRAGVAIVKRVIQQSLVPLLDFIVMLAGLYSLRYVYETKVKLLASGNYFQEWMINIAFPSYALLWMASVYLNGGYDRPVRLTKIFRGIIIGTGLILIVYSLLPENFRFSRAIILLGTLSSLISYFLIRVTLHFLKIKSFSLSGKKTKRIGIIGNPEEFERVKSLLKETDASVNFLGFINTEENGFRTENYLGNITQLDEIIPINQLDEIIFCARDLSSGDIIGNMMKLVSTGVDFKIAPPESYSIIGSNSIDTAGDDLYTIDFNSVSKPANKRKKRMLDISLSLVFIFLTPIIIWFIKEKINYLRNLVFVFFGMRSWVGYGGIDNTGLPNLKSCVLSPDFLFKKKILSTEEIKKMNLDYSKNYRVETDLKIVWRNLSLLGNQKPPKNE